MNQTTTMKTHNGIRLLKNSSAVLGFAVLGIVALFAFEAAPMRASSLEASASTEGFDYDTEYQAALDGFNANAGSWGSPDGGSFSNNENAAIGSSCTISADVEVTDTGVDVTLNWTTSPAATYVTINEFPGDTFEAVGSKQTFITDSTEFVAYTHYDDSNDTATCYVTVNYTPQVVIDDPPVVVDPPTVDPPLDYCALVEVDINDDSFTWTSAYTRLKGYTVEFCDDSDPVSVSSVSYKDTATFTFNSRIKSVKTCGCGDCVRKFTQTCEPEPKPPSCPLTATNDTVVVIFDQSEKLMSHGDSDLESTDKYSVSLPAGTYDIQTASWDGYLGRVNVSQPHEQWYLDLVAGNTTVAKTGFTTDLEDFVTEAYLKETVATGFSIGSAVDGVYARHAYWVDESSWNSVVPICASFKRKPVEHDIECTMSISPTKVSKGDSATLTWTSKNATDADIDQGIGNVNLNGSKSVKVTGNTTYTGTFSDDDGHEVTCTASVTIKSGGGGGRCLNCDDDDDEETVVTRKTTDKEPTVNFDKKQLVAGAAISLSQVPYTGFDASPLLTAFFWITVLALSVIIAYVVTVVRSRSMAYAQHPLLMSSTDDADSFASQTETPSAVPPTIPVGSTEIADVKPTMAPVASESDASFIEEMAHKVNILLSPEATREIVNAVEVSHENSKTFVEKLFENAQAAYPREDGWILLSKERCLKLLGVQTTVTKSVQESSQQVRSYEFKLKNDNGQTSYGMPRTAPQTIPQARPQAPTRTSNTNSHVAVFVRYLVQKDQQKAFELLRTITAHGVDVGVFIARVVRELDEVYKQRLEGNRNPDEALVELTEKWPAEVFENVLGSLVECIDYSYASPRIGTKIALAKVFEQFSR